MTTHNLIHILAVTAASALPMSAQSAAHNGHSTTIEGVTAMGPGTVVEIHDATIGQQWTNSEIGAQAVVAYEGALVRITRSDLSATGGSSISGVTLYGSTLELSESSIAVDADRADGIRLGSFGVSHNWGEMLWYHPVARIANSRIVARAAASGGWTARGISASTGTVVVVGSEILAFGSGAIGAANFGGDFSLSEVTVGAVGDGSVGLRIESYDPDDGRGLRNATASLAESTVYGDTAVLMKSGSLDLVASAVVSTGDVAIAFRGDAKVTATRSSVLGDITGHVGSLALSTESHLIGRADVGAMSIDPTSRWTMDGDSSLGQLTLAGTIDIGSAAPATLTLAELVGQDGTIALRTALNGGDTDRLAVENARGQTHLDVVASGPGSASAIKLVDITSTSAADAFRLVRPIRTALWTYGLNQSSDLDWYLVPTMRDDVALLPVSVTVQQDYARSTARRASSAAQDHADGWITISGATGAVQDATDYSAQSVSAGICIAASATGSIHGYLGYGRVDGDRANAKTEHDAYSVGLVGTRAFDRSRLIGALQATVFRETLTLADEETGSTRSANVAVMFEASRDHSIVGEWTGSPLATVVAQYVSPHAGRTKSLGFDLDSSLGLQTRVGYRASYTAGQRTAWFAASLWREWAAETSMAIFERAGGGPGRVESSGKGNWGEIAAGCDYRVTRSIRLHGDLTYAFGARETISGRVGATYEF